MPKTPRIGVRWIPVGLLEHLGSLDTVVGVRVELSAPEQHFGQSCLYLQHTKAKCDGSYGACRANLFLSKYHLLKMTDAEVMIGYGVLLSGVECTQVKKRGLYKVVKEFMVY